MTYHTPGKASDAFETYLPIFQGDLANGITTKALRSYVSVMAFSGMQTRAETRGIQDALDLAISRHNKGITQ